MSRRRSGAPSTEPVKVVVVGAGIEGLLHWVELRRAGIVVRPDAEESCAQMLAAKLLLLESTSRG
jgi:hypothetical protein